MTSSRKKRQRYRARGESEAYVRGGWGSISRGDLVQLRKAIREWDIPNAARLHLPETICREMQQTPYNRNALSCVKTLIAMEKANVRDVIERLRLKKVLEKLSKVRESRR